MKPQRILFFLGMVALVLSSACTTSKQALTSEIERLKQENAIALQQKQQLESENARLQQSMNNLNIENSTLKSEMNALQSDLDRLSQDYERLRLAYEGGGGYNPPPGGGYNPPGGGTGEVPVTDSPKVGNCETVASSMRVNTSYTLNYNPIPSGSWGVQVASLSDLCQAEDAANRFSGRFSQYRTYIRVKSVSGRRLYSIIYGAFANRSDASSVADQLKRSGAEGMGLGSFVVQH